MFNLVHKLKERGESAGQAGFTLIELLIVIILSTIMLAGMVALVSSSFNLFNTSKNLESVSDSSRRCLSSMARQLKTALHFDNANTSASRVAFWGDIDSDNNDADTSNYVNAEKVEFYYDAGAKRVMQLTTEPAGGGQITSVLGSYVNSLTFYYFQPGVMPQVGDPPPNRYTGTDFNADIGMVRIQLVLQRGQTTRTYFQDVFLRIIQRED